jgi:hypothetical protein
MSCYLQAFKKLGYKILLWQKLGLLHVNLKMKKITEYNNHLIVFHLSNGIPCVHVGVIVCVSVH